MWRWLVAFTVAEIVIPFPMIAVGEERLPSSLAAIMVASVPLIVALLAIRFDPSERPTPIRALGLAIGFGGVIALVGLDVAGHGGELLGVGAVMLAAVGYAIGPMLLKHRLAGLDPRATMGASLALASLILAPWAALDTPRATPSAGAIGAVVVLGLLCTARLRRLRDPDRRGRAQPRHRDHLRQPGGRGHARRAAARRAPRRRRGGGAAADPRRRLALDRRPPPAGDRPSARAGRRPKQTETSSALDELAPLTIAVGSPDHCIT